MSRRAAGVGFCAIAAFLYASRYITAAISGSNVTWNSELFPRLLIYVGNSLTILSIVSLVVGVLYLVWAEIAK